MSDTATRTIRDESAEFTAGFNTAIGPELAAVFADEQADLVANGVPAGTVQVGDSLASVPLRTVDDAETTIAEVAAGRAAVLVFYRGAWCPYCNLTLKHYNETLAPALAERDVALIAISPQHADGSRAAVANGDLGFTVLSDPDNRLARALGIVTAPSPAAQEAHTTLGFAVKDSNADDTPAIPYPTVLVIDPDQTVRFADIHVDYTTRTETEEILAVVDAS